jgi:hypothetical protein
MRQDPQVTKWHGQTESVTMKPLMLPSLEWQTEQSKTMIPHNINSLIVVGKIAPRPPIENHSQDWNSWVVIKKADMVFKFQTYKDSAWPARTQ